MLRRAMTMVMKMRLRKPILPEADATRITMVMIVDEIGRRRKKKGEEGKTNDYE